MKTIYVPRKVILDILYMQVDTGSTKELLSMSITFTDPEELP